MVQAGKDTTYFLVICIGFGITAVLLYYVFGELFSTNSVQRLFSGALKRIRADEKVKLYCSHFVLLLFVVVRVRQYWENQFLPMVKCLVEIGEDTSGNCLNIATIVARVHNI